MKSPKEINYEWGNNMLDSLTQQDTSVVFMFGLTKDSKVKVALTTDLGHQQLIDKLEGIIKHLKENYK